MPSSYLVEDLGPLGGSLAFPSAINARGEVVGSLELPSGHVHAALWDPGKAAQDLGTLGGSNSVAYAINSHGEIVGKADTGSDPAHPFDLQPGGSMTDLTNAPPQSSFGDSLLTARGVSDTGVIVGKGSFNHIDLYEISPYAFDPPSGTLNQLDSTVDAVGEAVAVGGTRAVANLVQNNSSQAVVEDVNTPDSSVALPGIASQKPSTVYGISAADNSGTQFAAGQAIDASNHTHLVLWTIPTDPHSATVTDLGPLAGANGGEAFAANAQGDVVGAVSGNTLPHFEVAFIKEHGGTITQLDHLLPSDSGIELTTANGINDSGQICAAGYTRDGQYHAFLLTPVATAPPQVTLTSAPDVNSAGATTYSFTVTYTDDVGIDTSTLDNATQVTGPAGYSQVASLTSTSGNPNQLTATYTVTAPGGAWDFSDNGTYTISLLDNVVKTTAGEPLAGGTLGHFVAAINVTRGSISGTVYSDANANGKRDPGEGGAANIDVFLDLNGNGTFDSGDRITRTDANGAYSFAGLLPGDYRVREYVLTSSHVVTAPSSGIQFVHLTEGQNLTGVDFGDWAFPQITDIAGQNLVNPRGKTAQFDQPATVLHVTGVHFNPGDVFYFGNDRAFAGPTNLHTDSYGVQTFDLQVPAFATTRALVVNASTSNRFVTLLPTFTVDSYRNLNGYSFYNDGKTPDESADEPGFSFDELTTVYGGNQTDISAFGYDTGVPNPLALLELAIINAALPPSSGECLGFSLSSARLSLGLQPSYQVEGQPYRIDDLPAPSGFDTASTVWQLGNSNSLRELIRLGHLEQTTSEFLGNYIGQIVSDEVSGVSHLINGVKGELAQGRPVLICIQEGGFGGHAVLAYNVEDGPNGSEILDIYDPNTPFLASEDHGNPSTNVPGVENGIDHGDRVLASSITIDSSGHWQYNGADNVTGGLGSIAMAPLSVFDSHTLLANLGALLNTLLTFGSAAETQVTDSAGHTLLNPDGSPNTNPSTMIPNAARYVAEKGTTPLDLVEGTGTCMQTITGTGSGTYGAASLSSDAMATISGISTAKGQADQFGLDPASDMLTFIPGVLKNLNADLMVNAADGTEYEAEISTNAAGGTQTLQFHGNHVVVKDDGPMESISLNFGHISSNYVMESFSTGRINIAPGDTVDVLPGDWTDLQNTTATVVVRHTDGSTTTTTVSNEASGGVLNLQEGVSYNGPVAAFSNVSSTGLSAVIDWGDGTTSAGTVGVSGTAALVGGSHTYARQGYFPVRVTLSDASGPLGEATSEAAVADASFSLTSSSVSAFAGVPFTGTIATLTDSSSGDEASDFDVTIDWGDGSSSAGTLQTTSAGHFDVRGSHTWANVGLYSVAVTVTEHGSASGQGATLQIGSDTNFSGTVAQFLLPIPGTDPGDYVATIDWGDNTTSTGTLTLQSDGTVTLSGSHTYAAGNKSYVTHFTVTGGPSATTTSTAAVGAAVGTVTGRLFDDVNGNGKMDPGETGIPGQVVFVDENNGQLDSGEPQAVSDSSGVYTISNVPAGNIRVMESVPSGLRVDAPASGYYDVTLDPGGTLSNLDFANTQLALISGTVFVDANGNGTRDSSEPGQANQIVYLDLNNDGMPQPTEPTAITDSTGAFAFTVNAGTYLVRLQPFSDLTITTPAGGAYSVTVGQGETNSGGLFGVTPLAPAAPANLTATAGNAQVSLSWAAGQGATGYNVYRGTSPGGEGSTPINASPLTGTTFTDTDLSNGTTYYYEVTAVNAGGESGKSNEAFATPLPAGFTLQGKTLSVTGSSGNDSFAFTAGSVYTVTLNGETYQADPAQVDAVLFGGGGGDDSATLTDPNATAALLFPGSGSFSGPGYAVSVNAVSTISVYGGASATATLHGGTGGSNTFVGTSSYASLSGSGYSLLTSGFHKVFASATAGGRDKALLYDSLGQGTFGASPSYAYFQGKGFFNEAIGFSSVYAHALKGGNDAALLYDTLGQGTFGATPAYAYFRGAGYFNEAIGFASVYAHAPRGGSDRALLYDTLGHSTFGGTPAYSYFRGAGYFNKAAGFASVYGHGSSDGSDYALLVDSAGDDTFRATPTSASMQGAGFFNEAVGFARLTGYSIRGGRDAALLYDSAGNDVFAGTNKYAYLEGGGFFNRANGFERVTARSSGGSDRAYLYGSRTSADHYAQGSTYAELYGEDFTLVASAFGYVYVNPKARR